MIRGTTLIPVFWQALGMRNVHKRHPLLYLFRNAAPVWNSNLHLNLSQLPADDCLSLSENKVLLNTFFAFSFLPISFAIVYPAFLFCQVYFILFQLINKGIRIFQITVHFRSQKQQPHAEIQPQHQHRHRSQTAIDTNPVPLCKITEINGESIG